MRSCASASVINDRSRHARPRNRTAAASSLSWSFLAIRTSSAAASSRSTCGRSAAAVRAASRSPPARARRRRVSGEPCAVTNVCSQGSGQFDRSAWFARLRSTAGVGRVAAIARAASWLSASGDGVIPHECPRDRWPQETTVVNAPRSKSLGSEGCPVSLMLHLERSLQAAPGDGGRAHVWCLAYTFAGCQQLVLARRWRFGFLGAEML